MGDWNWDCFAACGPQPAGIPGALYASCFQSCVKASGWRQADDVSFELPVWAALLSSFFLVLLSGLFSGLTLGLLSLDLVGLRILAKGGEPDERIYASQIIPVREHGNLLLCTLLLGNTSTNSAISILLSGVTSGAIGLLVSTFVILILGEIMPQAVCSRHSLYLGAKVINIVKMFMVLFLPITWPLAFVLDKLLGRDIGTVYSQEELKRLIEIHVEDPVAQAESGLTITDHRLLTGVLGYKDKIVRDVMTKIGDAFVLEKTMRLNFATLSRVYVSGCSRIPVFEGERDNIVGILFVKDLILVDPDDEMEVSTVMAFRGRTVSRVYDCVTLDKVFLKFMAGNNHMLIAHEPPPDMAKSGEVTPISQTRVTGLITLEDVLEEMINSEIYDESDENERASRQRDKSAVAHQNDTVSVYLNLFDPKMRGNRLSPQESQAVFAFLTHNIEEFRCLTSSELAFKGLIRTAEVVERGASNQGGGTTPTSGTGPAVGPPMFADLEEDGHGQRFWNHASQAGVLLYERGRPSLHFTLILQGKVLIRTGSEAFELDLGPWSHLGNKALVNDLYLPDFDAVAVAPYRILRIHRGAYRAAMDASRLDAAREYQAVKQQMRMQATDGGPSTSLPPPMLSIMGGSGDPFSDPAFGTGLSAADPEDISARGGSAFTSLFGANGASAGARFGLSQAPVLSSEVELALLDEPSARGGTVNLPPASEPDSEQAPLLSPATSLGFNSLSHSQGFNSLGNSQAVNRNSLGNGSLSRVSPDLLSLVTAPSIGAAAAAAAAADEAPGLSKPMHSPRRSTSQGRRRSSTAGGGSGGGADPRQRTSDGTDSPPHEPLQSSPSAALKNSQNHPSLRQLFSSLELPFLPSFRQRDGPLDGHGASAAGGLAGSHVSDGSDSEKEWPEWDTVDATTFGPSDPVAPTLPVTPLQQSGQGAGSARSSMLLGGALGPAAHDAEEALARLRHEQSQHLDGAASASSLHAHLYEQQQQAQHAQYLKDHEQYLSDHQHLHSLGGSASSAASALAGGGAAGGGLDFGRTLSFAAVVALPMSARPSGAAGASPVAAGGDDVLHLWRHPSALDEEAAASSISSGGSASKQQQQQAGAAGADAAQHTIITVLPAVVAAAYANGHHGFSDPGRLGRADSGSASGGSAPQSSLSASRSITAGGAAVPSVSPALQEAVSEAITSRLLGGDPVVSDIF